MSDIDPGTDKLVPEDKKITLLRKLAADTAEKLRPELSLSSSIGFTYPTARSCFECAEGAEVDQLEDLARSEHLERVFRDKVHLCPFCFHSHLNFRELCPKCSSPDSSITSIVHHFRCAYAAPEAEFEKGLNLVCPKCNVQLRHIGVDYEKPSDTFLCNACKEVYTDPEINCLCFSCQRSFPVSDAILKNVYEYSISHKGALAAERGALTEASLESAFVDAEIRLYTPELFNLQMGLEVSRCRRYKRSFSLLMLVLEDIQRMKDEQGIVATATFVRELALAVKQTLRDTDIPTKSAEEQFLFLLCETPVKNAETAAKRIFDRLKGVSKVGKGAPRILIALAGYPEHGESQPELVTACQAAVDRAPESGDYTVVVATAKTK